MRIMLPAAGLAAVVLLAACAPGAQTVDAAGPRPEATVRTAFPDLAAAVGEPELPSLKLAHPMPGQAVLAAGPFNDRLAVQGLVFDGQKVAGTITITSDVSDLLELQVLAGFYDSSGALLGTARYEHHADGSHSHSGPPTESEDFAISVPAELAGRAASAAIGVPVLVNE